jgi:hypothetical protein
VLSVIWCAHWRFTIDGFPFIHLIVVDPLYLAGSNQCHAHPQDQLNRVLGKMLD